MPQNYPEVWDGTIAFKELKDQIEDVAIHIAKELHDITVVTKETVKEFKEMCDGPLRSLSSKIQDESQNNEENWEDLFQHLDDIQTEQVNLNAKFIRNHRNLQVVCTAMIEILKNQASERTKLTDLTASGAPDITLGNN
ncbi:uncharacterized protein MELLADRAFT_60096 [Melampsora larici-populina 98AG31]|uniref:Uncharacterized protein n=1 Tax=Melampsora larici-populina (strain 98AG31 / pathotype 3-4-7) TaxID=747676 RepID=F4R8Q7_MELLP|nr:uncharacterized protein MELLADRAFT_60096 [Melampsora larici-populina 98AG31]EGG11076.1 hypothetical protein MELLADRAFT_60096 [Melampsora larici-populina 98AG31]